RPVGGIGRAPFGQAGQRSADFGQRDAEVLRDADDSDAPQYAAIIAALIAKAARGADQALGLIKMQRRHCDTAAAGHFANAEKMLHGDLNGPLGLRHFAEKARAWWAATNCVIALPMSFTPDIVIALNTLGGLRENDGMRKLGVVGL